MMMMMKSGLLLLSCLFGSASGVELTPINYTHDGFELQGYQAVPENMEADARVPAVVILPNWDGVNEYEQGRAEMFASESGYVAFAADIFGRDNHNVANISERMAFTRLFFSNATLFSERIQAAVETVRGMEMVDGDQIAIVGYCFGGTGVLVYAMTGINDVQALVSFHPTLGSVPDSGDKNVTPKVLVLSGGEDQFSTSGDNLAAEKTLDSVNADWEITRYSNVKHAFTVFGSPDYNEMADMRSWASAKTFLKEALGEVPFAAKKPSDFDVFSQNYTDIDGTELKGYYQKPNEELNRPRPIVVVIPDWDGVNDYEKQRVVLLAKEGYYAFGADIFGADLQDNLSFEKRRELTQIYRSNSTLFVQRIESAIEQAKSLKGADPTNIAVIGYCFGGTGVIELAFSGTEEIKAVVAFHGGLRVLPNATTAISPYTLVLSGGDDDAHGNQTVLEAALNEGDADWEITRYSGVDHGFTSWTSPAYSLKADYRSWESMLTSFEMLWTDPPVESAAFGVFGKNMGFVVTMGAILVLL